MFDTQLFPTEQNSKMSEDSNTWPEAISTIAARKFPELTSYIDKIIFQKVEKTRGYAVGYILLQDNTIRIPFIVDKFILQPLDVFIKGVRYGHLNRRISQRLIAASWPFKQLSAQDHAKFMNKTASTMEYIGLSAREIENNPQILKYAEYLADTMPEVVVELGHIVSRNDMMEKTASEAGDTIAAIERTADKTNFRLVKFGQDDSVVSFKEAVDRVGMGFVKQAMDSPVYLNPLTKKYEPIKNELDRDQFSFDSGSDSQYPKTVAMSDGAIGTIRGNVYELRNIKIPDSPLGHIFLSTRQSNPAYQVVPKNGSHQQFYTIPTVKGLMGEIVDDLHRPSTSEKNGAMAVIMNNVIYGPFEITNKAVMAGDSIYSIREGYEYDKMQIHVTPHVKKIIVDKDVIYVPDTAKLIWLGKPFQADNSIVKQAAVWVKLIATPDKSAFNLIDNGVSGIAPAELQNLTKTKAVAALMHSGLSEDESKIAIQKAMSDGSYSFQATPTATQSENQTRAQVTPSEKNALQKAASVVIDLIDKSGIIKIAADNRDRQTVDLALGLRMITPESVRRYRLLIPKIDDTIDGLCKLLLAKRLGGDTVPIDEKKLETSVSTLSEIGYELTGV